MCLVHGTEFSRLFVSTCISVGDVDPRIFNVPLWETPALGGRNSLITTPRFENIDTAVVPVVGSPSTCVSSHRMFV